LEGVINFSSLNEDKQNKIRDATADLQTQHFDSLHAAEKAAHNAFKHYRVIVGLIKNNQR
jgi:hypothetical protein